MSDQRPTRLGRLGPRAARIAFNLWPCVRGSGTRVEHIAADWSSLRVRLRLSWRTRNYVGSIFGGSLYAAADPFMMLLLIRRLGPGYVVWDKSASIRFRRPARTTLRATFEVDDDEVEQIRAAVDAGGGVYEPVYVIDLTGEDDTVYATVTKHLYVATTAAHAERLAARTDDRRGAD